MSQGNRRPIYLSPTKDEDLLVYIKPLEEKYSFSSIVKELMRDGIKYRTAPQNKLSIQSNTQPLSNIEFKEKEISDEDLDSALDSF